MIKFLSLAPGELSVLVGEDAIAVGMNEASMEVQ